MKLNNRGLEIIKRYAPDADIIPGHDQIWVGDYERVLSYLTDGEKKMMQEDGWFEAEGAWSHFC